VVEERDVQVVEERDAQVVGEQDVQVAEERDVQVVAEQDAHVEVWQQQAHKRKPDVPLHVQAGVLASVLFPLEHFRRR